MAATDAIPLGRCVECGSYFERLPSERWKVRCLSCWRRNKQAERSADWSAGFNAGIAAARADMRPVRAGPSLDAEARERLRALLQLCHPDKHHGSPLAHDVTAWLLDIKRRASV